MFSCAQDYSAVYLCGAFGMLGAMRAIESNFFAMVNSFPLTAEFSADALGSELTRFR